MSRAALGPGGAVQGYGRGLGAAARAQQPNPLPAARLAPPHPSNRPRLGLTPPPPWPPRSCVLMCHAPRKQYYKKFLFEPLPVESHLDQRLHDTLAAEVVTR